MISTIAVAFAFALGVCVGARWANWTVLKRLNSPLFLFRISAPIIDSYAPKKKKE